MRFKKERTILTIIMFIAMLFATIIVCPKERINNLGIKHYNRNNPKRALALFYISAIKGYCLAINNVGVLYVEGEGIKPNYKKAHAFFKLSKKRCNAAISYYNTASLYATGRGVEKSYETAYELYTTAKNTAIEQSILGLPMLCDSALETIETYKGISVLRIVEVISSR